MKNIVLASGSPYRQELLNILKLDFITASPDIDESGIVGEPPAKLAARLSSEKAKSLTLKYPDHLIIGSDQVVMLKNQQMTKPGNRKNCIAQLMLVSGNKVQFYTGVCVLNSRTGKCITEVDLCTVYFRTLTSEQIERYVDMDKPFDCAGGFKSESLGIAIIERIVGEDPNALIGLPLIKLIKILGQFDFDVI